MVVVEVVQPEEVLSCLEVGVGEEIQRVAEVAACLQGAEAEAQ